MCLKGMMEQFIPPNKVPFSTKTMLIFFLISPRRHISALDKDLMQRVFYHQLLSSMLKVPFEMFKATIRSKT